MPSLPMATNRAAPPQVVVGGVYTTMFKPNPKGRNGAAFRSSVINGERADKILLTNSPGVQAGVEYTVRVTRIHKPDSPGRGYYSAEVLGRAVDADEPFVHVDPELARRLYAILDSPLPIPVMLEGEAGTGKTSLAKFVGRQLQMEFVSLNMARVAEADEFLATWRNLVDEHGHGRWMATPTELLRAIHSASACPGKKWLLFLDEWSRAHPRVRNSLLPMIEATDRTYFDPIRQVTDQLPKNIRWIAASNPANSHYGGASCFDEDRAHRDRWSVLLATVPSPEAEREILARKWPSLARSKIDLVVELANRVRAHKELPVSVRSTVEACAYLAHANFADLSREELTREIAVVLASKWSGRHDDPESDAGQIFNLVMDTKRMTGLGQRPLR